MTKTVLKIARIWNSQFKYNYLKNEKSFVNFLLHFWNVHQILNILKEKMLVIANVFPKLQTVNSWLDISLKSAVSEHALTVNMWKRPKYLRKLNEST